MGPIRFASGSHRSQGRRLLAESTGLERPEYLEQV